MSNLLLIRTRFIDDTCKPRSRTGRRRSLSLVRDSITRAYRYADRLKGKKVFEVDYQSTQQIKKQRLEEALGSIPSHVQFAEIDFKRDTLRDVLRAAGYTPVEKTFFIWEA